MRYAFAVMSKPPQFTNPVVPSGAAADVGGQWSVHLAFVSGSAEHNLVFEQKDGKLRGTHSGDILKADLRGAEFSVKTSRGPTDSDER